MTSQYTGYATLASPVGDAVVVPGTVETEFLRSDVGDVVVPIGDISTLLGSGGLNTSKSIALYWKVPVKDAVRGNLLSLKSSEIEIANDSPVDIYVRAARPYGFEDDPTGIAHWEVLGPASPDFILPPGRKHVYHVVHHYNNFVVPLRSSVSGHDHVHVASFSLSRARLSAAATGVPTSSQSDSVLFRMRITTRYEADGGAEEDPKAYTVRVYNDSAHMEYVNKPPPKPTKVGDLRSPKGQVEAIRLRAVTIDGGDTSASQPTIGIVTFIADGSAQFAVDGLDSEQAYFGDFKIPCYSSYDPDNTYKSELWGIGQQAKNMVISVAAYLVYLKKCKVVTPGAEFELPFDGWVMAVAPFTPTYVENPPKLGPRQWKNLGYFGAWNETVGTTWIPEAGTLSLYGMGKWETEMSLYPVSKKIGRLSCQRMKAKNVGLVLSRLPRVTRSEHLLKAGDWKDTVLSTISFVLKVVKTALAAAGALGLAASRARKPPMTVIQSVESGFEVVHG